MVLKNSSDLNQIVNKVKICSNINSLEFQMETIEDYNILLNVVKENELVHFCDDKRQYIIVREAYNTLYPLLWYMGFCGVPLTLTWY